MIYLEARGYSLAEVTKYASNDRVWRPISMDELFLKSLEIRQFRAFENLRIPRLNRVNLIVGKNNVGKTSLLEALRLYAYQGSPSLIWDLLQRRDESREPIRYNVRD